MHPRLPPSDHCRPRMPEVPWQPGRFPTRGRQCTDDQASIGRQPGDLFASQVPQSALDPITNDRRADSLGHHKADQGTLVGFGITPAVHDDGRGTDPSALSYGAGEVVARTHPHRLRQHRSSPPTGSAASGHRSIRPTAERGPCGGGRSARRARRGCASGDGNHGYGCGAGCSAGKCACSRVYSDVVRVYWTDARVQGR